MTAPSSAGLLLFRRDTRTGLQVLIGHMGGPFWARKDEGAWSIPKGEPGPDEPLHDVAVREFTEELDRLHVAAVPHGRRLTRSEAARPAEGG